MSGTTGGGGITSLGGAKYDFTLDISSLVQNVNTAEQAVQTATQRIAAMLQTIDPAAKLAAAGVKDLSQAVQGANQSSQTFGTRLGTLNTSLANVGQRGNAAGAALAQVNTAQAQAAQSAATSTSAIQAQTAALQATTRAAQQTTAALATMQQQAATAATAAASAATATTATAGGAHGGGGIGAQLGGAALSGAGFAVGLGGAEIAIHAVEGAVGELKAGVIDFNKELENGAVKLQGWVGGMDNAKAVMADLAQKAQGAQFGSFGIEELAKGEASLQRLGQANDAVRAKVADVAVATGRSYGEMALQLGRLYETAQMGGPVFNREITQLERMGAITSEWANAIRNAQKEGKSQAEIIDMINQATAKYNGTAEAAGNSLEGLQKRGTVAFQALAAESGKPIFDGIEQQLKALDEHLASGNAKEWAATIGTAVDIILTSLHMLGQGLIEQKALWDGFSSMLKLALLTPIQALTDALNKLSGGQLQGLLQGINQQIADTKAGILNAGKDLNTAGDQIANDWAHANAAKWTDAGKSAGDGVKKGAGDADAPGYFRAQGSASAMGFIEGFNKQQLSALNSLSQFAEGEIYGSAAKKGFDPTGVVSGVREQLPAFIAGSKEAADAIQKIVTPEVYQHMLDYRDALNGAEKATLAFTLASGNLKGAQELLKTTQEAATKANKEATDAVKAAQDVAANDAAAYDERIQKMRDASDAEKQGAQDARAARQSDIAAQQDGFDALKQADADAKERRQAGIQGVQDVAEAQKAVQSERMRQIDAQVTAAQVAQEHAQALMRQHTEMLTAIEQGQADQYIAEVGQIDDVSQRMYDRYAKEMGLLLDLKRAKDDAARQGHNAEDARILQYEEQIHSAYNSGNIQQARLLERSEQRYKSQADFNNQLTDQRAKVAGDNVTDVQTQLQREGQAQTAEDKGAEANAKRQLQAVGDVKAAQSEADRVTNQAQAERIKSAQEADKQATQAATDRQRIVERQIKASQDADKAANIAATEHQKIVDGEIKGVEREKATVGRADKVAIDDATTHATIVKNEWDTRITGAKNYVEQMTRAEQSAKNQEQSANNTVTTMERMTNALKTWAEQYLPAIVENLTRIADLAKQPPSTQSAVPLTSAPQATPGQNPDQDPTFQAGPNTPSADTGTPQAPPGTHLEQGYDGRMWWIPDGKTKEDFENSKTPGPNDETPHQRAQREQAARDEAARNAANTTAPPTPQPGPAPSPAPAGARAGGGPVMAGGGVTVGEFGAETFVPKTSGFILPSDITARLLGGAPRVPEAGGMGGGGMAYHVTVHNDFSGTIVREEADVQKIGAVIARTMIDASAMARRQGTPAPGYLGG